MAEALGAVASILTVLDATIETIRLVSKLKHVPTVIYDVISQAQQLQEVIKGIQNNPALNQILVHQNHDPLKRILQDCEREVSSFEQRLQPLIRKASDGRLKKGWNAVLGVVKEKEFLEAARKIEAHKTTLLVCLGNQSLFVITPAFEMEP